MPEPATMYRVPYGHEQIEFMVPPWYDVDVLAGPADAVTVAYDVLVTGPGAPHDADLRGALRGTMRLARIVRPGGAVVIAAQLPEGAGQLTEEEREDDPERTRRLVIVAASEAPEAVRLARLRAAVDVEEALEIAYEHIGRPPRASLLVVRA